MNEKVKLKGQATVILVFFSINQEASVEVAEPVYLHFLCGLNIFKAQ